MQQAVDSRQIHELLAGLPRFDATFRNAELPRNGIYFFYEEGEKFEGRDRIVRVGTHIGEGRLVWTPHLHISAAQHVLLTARSATQLATTLSLAKLHFPTHRVGLSELARFLTVELGVGPRRNDWESVLEHSWHSL